MRKIALLFLFTFSILLLASCGKDRTWRRIPDATPTPTATPSPSPTATPSPSPTATPTPTSTPTPSPSPTPTPTPPPTTFGFIQEDTGNVQMMLGAIDWQGQFSASSIGEPSSTLVYFAFSPDKQKIALEVIEAGTNMDRILVADADGSDPVEIAVEASNGFLEFPVFTPDGTHVIWASQGGALMTASADNSDDPTTLVAASGLLFWEVSFSPDGTKMVGSAESAGGLNLVLLDADGTDPVVITTYSAMTTRGRYPTFTPDGSAIIFTEMNYQSQSRTVTGGQIYSTNLDGSSRQLLSNSNMDFFPRFVGGALLFESYRDGNMELYRMDQDGTEVSNLTDNSGFEGFSREFIPVPPPASVEGVTGSTRRGILTGRGPATKMPASD